MKINIYIDNGAVYRQHNLGEHVSFDKFFGHLDHIESAMIEARAVHYIKAEIDTDQYDIKMESSSVWPANKPLYSFVRKTARPYESVHQPDDRRIEPQL